MNQNAPETLPKLRLRQRLKYIEKNIIFQTQQEIAQACGVNRSTIRRDIDKWRKRGGYRHFLIKEFFELYGKERATNPSRALDRIIYLLTKDKEVEDTQITDIKVTIIDNKPNPI